MKQAIIIRRDLKMSCGKIAGQCCHASIRALFFHDNDDCIMKWFKEGETKVVLKVRSEEELEMVMDRCREKGLPYADVHDLGKTQIEAGTLTAVGIGPYPDEVIDGLVGDLKLL